MITQPTDLNFDGTWHCAYWYPSNEHTGDDVSEYQMQAIKQGDRVTLESLPKEDGSYLLVRLRLQDNNIVIGSWHETTAPAGLFKGAQYSGVGQLILDSTTMSMVGKWAGAGFDHKLKEMRVYIGNWEISRLRDS